MISSRRLRLPLAGLILLGGFIHLQQFLDGFSTIPIIGPMFMANAAASLVVAALLVWRREPIWVVGAGLVAAGSLAAILISRGPGLFGYISTTFEAPETLAVLFEGMAVLLAAFILIRCSQLATSRKGCGREV